MLLALQVPRRRRKSILPQRTTQMMWKSTVESPRCFGLQRSRRHEYVCGRRQCSYAAVGVAHAMEQRVGGITRVRIYRFDAPSE